MKKIVGLLLVAAVLSVAVYFVIDKKGKTPDTFAGKVHTQFAFENVDDLQKIFIADWGQNQAVIERDAKGGRWIYTNKATGKKYPARPDAIRTLLETVKGMRTMQPVAKAAIPTVEKSMAGSSRKVELFDFDGNKVRSYSVGGPATGDEGTYMIMDGSDRPYVVYMPSWVGSIHTRFITTEEDWRDKAIFRVRPADLEFVQVDYRSADQADKSFKIERKGAENFAVQAVASSTMTMDASLVNQDNAATYIDDFNSVVAEKIVYDKAQRDSIITQAPFAEVRYKTKGMSEPKDFRLYPVINPYADRGDGRPGARQKIERYFVDVDEDHFYIAQHLVIRKIFWDYKYFFRTEDVFLDKNS